MKISPGLSVRIEYELKVKGGEVIESSAKTGPLTYVHGQGKMLPGLERRLEGLAAGDEKRGEIPPVEAFGTEESQPLKEMSRGEFPAGAKLDPGATFEAKSPTGAPIVLKVVEANASSVQARLMHPLCGRALEYRVTVLSVSDPHQPPPPPGLVEVDLDEIKES